MEDRDVLTLNAPGSGRSVVFAMDPEGGEIWCRKSWGPNGGDQVVLNLEAKSVVSGGREFETTPSITIAWLDTPFDFQRLAGRTIEIATSFNEVVGDYMTTFYHDEHQNLEAVSIEFGKPDGNKVRLKVRGSTDDLYGDQKVAISLQTFVTLVDRHNR